MNNLEKNLLTRSVRESFNYSAPKVPKYLFTARLTPIRKKFQDLDLFRKEVEHAKAGIHHQPYTHHKRNVMKYRVAFLAFAFLFLVLGTVCFNIHIVHLWGLFTSTWKIKGFLVSLCFMCSLSGITMALAMKTEKEAVHFIAGKSKASIAKNYARKRMKMGLKRYFAFISPFYKEAKEMKLAYEEAKDKINEKKEEALHLVHNIATAETLNIEEKEMLLNQALQEFTDKLRYIEYNFKR